VAAEESGVMSAAGSLDTELSENPPELIALAEQSIPTPLVDASESLSVLLDALLERGLVTPVDHYHHEHEEAAARSAERARVSCLFDAYEWGRGALGDDSVDSDRYTALANLSHESSKRRAKQLKQVIRYPEPNELFIDIDTRDQLATFERNFEVLRRYIPVEECTETPSKRGWPHVHIVVRLKHAVTSIERIAMQTALGSDPMREILSIARVYTNQQHATCFFEDLVMPEAKRRLWPEPNPAVTFTTETPSEDIY
jgi:hypothetical protein